MNLVRNLSLAVVTLATTTITAFAGTTVTSPTEGATVPTPFTLTMSADSCSDRPVVFVGYSFDDDPYTAVWADQAINGPVAPPQGWHKLHVKVWNDQGAVCVTDVAINASAKVPTTSGDIVPSQAIGVGSIEAQGNWISVHDEGTKGESSGWTGIANSPARSGTVRQFSAKLKNYGGHRYAVHFGDDRDSQNFVYDTYIYIADSSDGIANLEFDLNQTMPNGETVIMGFQCDGWSRTWDYTVNAGSPQSFNDQWVHANAPCNPREWGANQWHHLQISYSHNSSGWVTYKSVWLDGNRQDLNVTAFSSFALGWGSSLMTNFQVDGNSNGTSWANIFFDNLTIYRW